MTIMPFKSEKQRRMMWARHPSVAREWTEKYGSNPQPAKKAAKKAAPKKGKK